MKKRNKRQAFDQIVRKLHASEVMLLKGKSLEEMLELLEVSAATFNRWRNRD